MVCETSFSRGVKRGTLFPLCCYKLQISERGPSKLSAVYAMFAITLFPCPAMLQRLRPLRSKVIKRLWVVLN